MKKSSLIAITLLSLLLLSMCGALVAAQYTSEQTVPVILDSNGVFTGSTQDTGVSYEVQGTAGATGSITAQIYNGNPQSTASIPDGVSLSHFVVVTFNMASSDFSQAKIYLSYTDQDVAGLQTPFTVYKYVASSNSYVSVPTNVDTAGKVITVTVNSIDDPLFAIGGAAVLPNTTGFSSTAWSLLAASIVIIVLLAVISVWYIKKR